MKLTSIKSILPKGMEKDQLYFENAWMAKAKASFQEDHVFLDIPEARFEGKMLSFVGNIIRLKRESGVTLTIEANPDRPGILLTGITLSSDTEDATIRLTDPPTVCVVFEVRSANSERVVIAMGLKRFTEKRAI